MTITQGYIDPASKQPCGWANGTLTCSVPGCSFPNARCLAVQREREQVASGEQQ